MPRLPLMVQCLIPFFAALFALENAHAADADPGKTAANLMLDKGWGRTKVARDVVTEQELNAPPLKDDFRVRAAHWLVLMYQGRYDLALDSVKVHLGKYPTSLDPLRAEVWMRMVGQEYGKAIAAAQKLGEAIPRPKQGEEQSPAAAAASDQAIVFLGHVSGFLEGPANKANEADRQRFEAALLAQLSDAQKDKFNFAKQDVLSQFRRLREQAGDLKQGAKQEAEAAKQEKLGKLNEQSEQLSKAKAKAEEDAKKAADDQKRKLADLERQDATLQLDWRRLQNDLAMLNNQIQRQNDQVKRLEQEAADPKNPQQQGAQFQLNTARNQLRDLNSRLNFTNNEIFRIEASHQRLVQQGLVSQWQAQNQGQQLQGQQNQIEKGMRKNANEQRRAEEGKAAADAEALALARKASVLNTEAAAFTTYDQFPFEEVKAKLLRALK
jgi:hypothetical protein